MTSIRRAKRLDILRHWARCLIGPLSMIPSPPLLLRSGTGGGKPSAFRSPSSHHSPAKALHDPPSRRGKKNSRGREWANNPMHGGTSLPLSIFLSKYGGGSGGRATQGGAVLASRSEANPVTPPASGLGVIAVDSGYIQSAVSPKSGVSHVNHLGRDWEKALGVGPLALGTPDRWFGGLPPPILQHVAMRVGRSSATGLSRADARSRRGRFLGGELDQRQTPNRRSFCASIRIASRCCNTSGLSAHPRHFLDQDSVCSGESVLGGAPAGKGDRRST